MGMDQVLTGADKALMLADQVQTTTEEASLITERLPAPAGLIIHTSQDLI